MLDDVQAYFMNDLEGGIARLADRPEGWAFVGMRTRVLVDQLTFARSLFPPTRVPKFLDCGSGLGFVTRLAKELGFAPTGLEYSEPYIALAKKLFPSTRSTQGDVLDFADYGAYDVIYYYGPFADEDMQRRFEEKIEAEARCGAVILANRKASTAWQNGGFELLRSDAVSGVMLRKR